MTDESAFLAAIATAPDDAGTLAAYADWLAEQGRDAEAHARRWMARHGKRPQHRLRYDHANGPSRKVPEMYAWAWYRQARDGTIIRYNGVAKPPAYCGLPSPVCFMLGGRFSYRDHAFYPSEAAAVAALAAGLAALLEAIRT